MTKLLTPKEYLSERYMMPIGDFKDTRINHERRRSAGKDHALPKEIA